MMNDLVLLTGTSGKVGLELLSNFRRLGFEVQKLAHNKSYSKYFLPNRTEVSSFRRVCIVHSGQPNAPRSPSTRKRYLQATLDLIDESSRSGYEFFFISSLSSNVENRSNYSKEKILLENKTLSRGGIVIKLGVLTGIEGSYAEQIERLNRITSLFSLNFIIRDSEIFYTHVRQLDRMTRSIYMNELRCGVYSYFDESQVHTQISFVRNSIRKGLTAILVVFSKLGSGRSDALLSLLDGMKIPK